jgi:rod shape-determining protein MreC
MEVLGQDRREGLGRRAESRALLVTMTIVSAILLLSSLYSAEASVFRKARETVLDAAEPLLSLLAAPISAIEKAVGDFSDYVNVFEQNKALRAENAELRQWMEEAIALRKTFAQYERLKAFHAPPEATPINAFVIGDSNEAFTHAMLVNVGVDEEVQRDQAVLDDRGLVGRIVEVGRRASRILLLTDARSRVPVFVEDANLEGILVGRANSRPVISFTASPGAPAFEPGQRVLTSGAGGVVPRGLPVGVIVGEAGGEATVELFADFTRARMVRIINYEFPQLEPVADSAAATESASRPAVSILAPPAPIPVEAGQGEDEPQQIPEDAPAPPQEGD